MDREFRIDSRSGDGSRGSAGADISAWRTSVRAQVEGGNGREVAGTRVQLAQATLPPPGDCTWGQLNALQADVDAACKRSRRCEDTDSAEQIRNKIEMNAQCISARQRINNACFRGGDIGHREQVGQDQNALQRCYNKLSAAEKREAEDKLKDEGFRNKMERLTGLTGAALTAYIIISEGSRAFPPRNAIPIP